MVGKVSCDGCFFKQNMLCAVTQAGPCATYRPNRPEGLRPPSQMRFNFRQERRLQVAWAFPSASEQVGAPRLTGTCVPACANCSGDHLV